MMLNVCQLGRANDVNLIEKYKEVQQGSKDESYAMCVLLKNNLLWPRKFGSISKTEFRPMSTNLMFPFGAEIWKDNLIKNVSDAMIKKHKKIADQIIALIEEEDKINVQSNL